MKLSPLQRKTSYVILLILWSLIVYNIVFPFPVAGLQQALYWTGVLMSVVHLAEVFIFYKKLKPETNKVSGVLMLYFFGIVYASSLDA